MGLKLTKEQISLIIEAIQHRIVSYNLIIQKCIILNDKTSIGHYNYLIEELENLKEDICNDMS